MTREYASDSDRTVRLLWNIFGFLLVLIGLHLLGTFLGAPWARSSLLQLLILLIPICLLFLHAALTLSSLRALLFIGLATSVGWIFEVVGLAYGVTFGGHYRYPGEGWRLLGVPVEVIFFWAVFIYSGYCLTNACLLWRGRSRPHRQQSPWTAIVPLVLLDAAAVVAIDLFMDPIQVASGTWVWLEGGPYFGVPLGNFLGWFLVASLVTLIFRSLEYFSPPQIPLQRDFLVMPVVGYAVLLVSFALSALAQGMWALTLVGTTVILPFVVGNFWLYRKR